MSDVCLTSVSLTSDVCLSLSAYIGPKSKTERPRKTKIGTEVAHVTLDADTIFKVKRSKGQKSRSPGRCTTALTRRAAAAVSVGTYWQWQSTATLQSALCMRGRLGVARRFGAQRGRRGAGAYFGGRPPTAYFIILYA